MPAPPVAAAAPGASAAPRPAVSGAIGTTPEEGTGATIDGSFAIPTGYGDHRIVVMVKDPWWLYAYWEISPSMERAVRSQLLPHEIAGLQSVLRVSDVTGLEFPAQPAHHAFDIPLSGLATNWYIQTHAPNRSFIVEVGLLTRTGRFLLLVRSNRVTTPRCGPSEVMDSDWPVSDDLYRALYGTWSGAGLSSGAPVDWGRASAAQASAGSWASPGAVEAESRSALSVRGFWCRVHTDLVIHGATEPSSTVLIQGQPVPVRRDGTFSLRLTLPDGAQTVTIDVTSPDGAQTTTMKPVITLAQSGPLIPQASTEQPPRSVDSADPRAQRRGGLM